MDAGLYAVRQEKDVCPARNQAPILRSSSLYADELCRFVLMARYY